MNRFKKTSIFPYNPNIFSEDEFSPSFVTDRPDPASIELERDLQEQAMSTNQPNQPDPVTSNSASQREPEPITSNKENKQFDLPQAFSLENVQPYPKAAQRKICTSNR